LHAHGEVECKRSTHRSYEQLLRLHVTPAFGKKQLKEITRERVKKFVAALSQATRTVKRGDKEFAVPRFSRNTMRLIVCALRSVLSAAVEDRLIESNPASKVGRFVKTNRHARPRP